MSGALRMESGPGGSRTVDAGPGDFVLVPSGAVRREGSPSSAPAEIVVVRAVRGGSTFYVDGPDPA